MQTIGGGPERKGRALSGDYLQVEELLLIKFADNLIIKKKKIKKKKFADNTYHVSLYYFLFSSLF